MNGKLFTNSVRTCWIPILQPFNWVNSRSVVILNNAAIRYVQEVEDLIETQAGCRLCYLPPFSPDLNPAEGIFSQIKGIMKRNDKLFQAYSAMAFGMVCTEDCIGHISNSGCI